jgi:hypothetical protein
MLRSSCHGLPWRPVGSALARRDLLRGRQAHAGRLRATRGGVSPVLGVRRSSVHGPWLDVAVRAPRSSGWRRNSRRRPGRRAADERRARPRDSQADTGDRRAARFRDCRPGAHDGRYSPSGLGARADARAHTLRAAGVRPGARVGGSSSPGFTRPSRSDAHRAAPCRRRDPSLARQHGLVRRWQRIQAVAVDRDRRWRLRPRRHRHLAAIRQHERGGPSCAHCDRNAGPHATSARHSAAPRDHGGDAAFSRGPGAEDRARVRPGPGSNAGSDECPAGSNRGRTLSATGACAATHRAGSEARGAAEGGRRRDHRSRRAVLNELYSRPAVRRGSRRPQANK